MVATGGLGNQLFVLAAGIEAALKADCPLYVDCSHFHADALRGFELNLLPLSSSRVSIRLVNEGGRRRSAPRRFIDRFAPSLMPSKYHLEPAVGVFHKNHQIGVGVEMRGYFQSHNYWPNGAKEVLRLLSKSQASQRLYSGRAGEPAPDLAIQVRQGDYLLPQVSDLYGVCTVDYFERAYDLVSRLIEVQSATIHSDSPENMMPLIARLDGKVMLANRGYGSALEALVDFARARSYIISNSSFGWWGASLGQFLNEQGDLAPVIAPRPWVLSRDLADSRDLLPLSWITIDSRNAY